MTSRQFLIIIAAVLAVLTALSQVWKADEIESGKTLLVWTTDPNPQRKPQVERFNELHPDFHLRIDPDNSTVMKVIMQSSAGMGPDLIGHVHPAWNYDTYHGAGVLWDVTEQAKEMGFGLDTLHPAIRPLVLAPTFTEDGRIVQRQYMYPANVVHTYIVYNKNLFDEYGLEYPPEDLTWRQYLDLAQKLTIREPGQEVPSVFGAAGANPKIVIWEMGGDILSPKGTRCLLGEKEAVDAMFFWYNLFYKHQVEPTPTHAEGVSSQGGWAGGPRSWFGEGRVGMYWGARWCLIQWRRFVKEQRRERQAWIETHPDAPESAAPEVLRMGACLVPRFEEGKRYTAYDARGVGINPDSENREDALAFLKYLAGEAYSELLNEGADSKPGNMAYNTLDRFVNPDWPGEKAVHRLSIETVPYGRIVPRSFFVEKPTVNRIFRNVQDKIRTTEGLSRDEIARIMKTAAQRMDLKIARAIHRSERLQAIYKTLLDQGAMPTAINPDEVD